MSSIRSLYLQEWKSFRLLLTHEQETKSHPLPAPGRCRLLLLLLRCQHPRHLRCSHRPSSPRPSHLHCICHWLWKDLTPRPLQHERLYQPRLLFCLAVACAVHSQILPNIFSPLSYFPSASQNCCDANTISVHGSATTQATPNTATIQASMSVNADTAALAIKQLSNAVNKIIAILKSNGLTEDNYQTSSFSLSPNTSYADGTSTVVGQIASQSFQITIPSIAKDGSNIAKLIDSLATVNGIVLNGLSFDVSNKTTVYQQLRQQAYKNAQSKAQDYSAALQICLGQLLSLTDSFSVAPVVSSLDADLAIKSSNSITPTTVNVGTIPISYDLNAVFALS